MNQMKAVIADPPSVDAAIENRYCVRAFAPTPVPRQTIEDILRVASRAASGTNSQPWHVHVLQGASRDALVEKVCAAYDASYHHPEVAARYQEEFDYYPREWVEPFLGRRRKNGWGLYGLLGIHKGDKDAMHAQHRRNYRFFDAPVGLVFTIDRVMGPGSLIDYGMFMQNIMVAARARGLHTCPQAAWNPYASIVLPHVGAGANEKLVGAMCLGWADAAAPVNTFWNEREPVEAFTHWMD